MNDVRTPVSGGGAGKGEADGVSGTPGGGPEGEVHGRTEGGESGGGAYPNPQTGKKPDGGGFMGHGGQSDIDYHGGGQGGEQGGDAPNAVSGSDSSDGTESGATAWAAPEYDAQQVTAGGRTFDVVQTNGVAEAETSGKVGSDAPYEAEQASPGAG